MFLNTFSGRLYIIAYLSIHLIFFLATWGYQTRNIRKMLIYIAIVGGGWTGLLWTWVNHDLIFIMLIPIGIVSGGIFYAIAWLMYKMGEDETYKIALPGNPKVASFIITIFYAVGLSWLTKEVYIMEELPVEWVKVVMLSLIGSAVFYYCMEFTYRYNQERFSKKKIK